MQESEYRKLAAVEDEMWYFAALHALIERQLTEVLRDGAAVLDAGCGTGGLIRREAARHPAWRWTGVDVDPLACSLARERTGKEIVEAPLERLPFADASFAAVTCADVIYHLDDDLAALQEMRRVLQPGGVLVLNAPAHRWLWSYHDEAVGGRRRYERRGMRTLLQQAGLKERLLTHWNTVLFPAIVARRKLFPAPAGGSDVHEVSGAMNALGAAATALERVWLNAAPLPFGSSIFAVALKGR